MQRFVIALAATLAVTASAASAMQATDLDIDGDGIATVSEVRFAVGDRVDAGELLVALDAHDG